MDTNHELRRSWETQQALHEPDRELRFQLMLDYVESVAGVPTRVLDLACGPGSITRRVRARFPFAHIVALDIDPLLLRLAADAFRTDERIEVVARNLNDPDWHLDLPGRFDAILTATATHWLPAPALERVYAGCARLLRPGGVFANADHMPLSDPTLRAAADTLHQNRLSQAFESGAESCDAWFARAYGLPAYQPLWPHREAAFTHWTGDLMNPAPWHLALLRQHGFPTAEVIWRRANDALTIAIR